MLSPEFLKYQVCKKPVCQCPCHFNHGIKHIIACCGDGHPNKPPFRISDHNSK